MIPDPDRLEGWKAIADHLGKSVRTARVWADERAMPVHRVGGGVFAYKSEIEEWTVTSSPPEPRAPDPKPTEPAKPIHYSRRWVIGGLAAAGLAGGVAKLVLPGQMVDFRVENRALVALDDKGKVCWRYYFPWDLTALESYSGRLRPRTCWIGDLNGDGKRELILAVKPIEKSLGDFVYCFGADGSVRWTFKTGRTIVDVYGSHMEPPYTFIALAIFEHQNPALARIVVTAAHHQEQAFQVAFLDGKGNVAGEYWHPGHLYHLAQRDIDHDGRPRLLLGGVNNGEHRAALVVLDPLSVRGLSTPAKMADRRFALLGMPEAAEEAVVLFQRSKLAGNLPFTIVQAVEMGESKIQVLVSEGPGEQGYPEFNYELDDQLNVVSVQPATQSVAQGLQHLNPPMPFEEECARLKAGVVVRRPSRSN